MAWLILPLALLAGYFVWTRLPMGADEQDDGLESAFAVLVCGVLLAGFTAFLLAEAGRLRPWALASVLAVCALAFRRLPRRLATGPAPSRRATATVLLLTLFLGATVAPASEEILGGRDQGVYVNTAGWVASEGSLRIRSAPLAEVATLQGGPFPLSGTYFAGYHVADAARGELTPLFFHLFPVYLALGGWLDGVRGALLVPPLLGVLSGLAVFFFLRRMLGPGAALAGTLLLSVNLAQVWGMRNPYSETLAQLSAFCTFWCVTRGHQTGGLRWGILGAAALGANFLNRIDAPLVLLLLLPALAAMQAGRPSAPPWIVRGLLPGTLLLAAWGVAHGLWFSPTYVRHYGPHLIRIWTITVVALAVTAAIVSRRRLARALLEAFHRRGPLVWAGAAAALCAVFAFAMVVRPHLEPFHMFPNHGVRSFREESLLRVGWYVSVPGLLAALLGTVVLLRRWIVDRRAEWAPFLLVFLGFSIVFLAQPNVHPDHPWMMRRFLPIVLPGLLIAITAAASWLWSVRGRWQRAARGAALMVVVGVAAHESRMTAPFWNYSEQNGAAAQIAALARDIPEDALLLFNRVGVAVRLATPLAFYWNRAVLPVLPSGTGAEAGTRRQAYEAQVGRWLAGRREVLFLTSRDGQSPFITELLQWREVKRFDLRMSTMDSGFAGPPRQPRTLIEHYRLMRAAPVEPHPCAPRTVEADTALLGMGQGLYGVESDGAERFRWAGPDARIVFPVCEWTDGGRPRSVRVRAGCWRAPSSGDCIVTVLVNGERAGAVALRRRLADFELPVPPAAQAGSSGPLELRFQGPRFVPAEAGLGTDRRVLSFQLGRVALRATESAPVRASAEIADR